MSVLMKCGQQMEASPKTANLVSVILILWDLDQNDPMWRFFKKKRAKKDKTNKIYFIWEPKIGIKKI